jgi:hypothetical protein
MIELTSTKFFLTLQEASQTGIDADGDVLKTEYGEFATLVFSKGLPVEDSMADRAALVYTRVELSSFSSFTGVLKKCVCLPGKGH